MSGPEAYGEAFADVYDDWYGDITDTAATVAFLRELAGAGAVLELGVGTGRIAVPLAAQGVPTWGVDASAAMLERLRRKAGAAAVHCVRADMADLPLAPKSFAVAFVAFNTLFNLADADDQQRCLQQTAGMLMPGGRLVLEAFVPGSYFIEGDGDVVHESHGVRGASTVRSVSTHRADEQIVMGEHIETHADGSETRRAWQIRYRTPAELDAMAAAAGLALCERWADWHRTPFGPHAERHVSVYQRPAANDPVG